MGAKVALSLFQDMPQAHPCGRGLGFLPRTVLKQGPHPLDSVGKLNTVVSDRRVQRGINLMWDGICQKLLHCDYAQRRGCEVPFFRTVSDMDVAPEPTGMCLWRVREKGTSRPRRPCR